MCTVVDLPTSILASLFAALMFTGIHNQFPLLTMPITSNNQDITKTEIFKTTKNSSTHYTQIVYLALECWRNESQKKAPAKQRNLYTEQTRQEK